MNDMNPLYLIAALFGVTLWHELGHLLAARWVGVPVIRLSIGLGPLLWQHSLPNAPDLALRVLPLGMSVTIPNRRTSDGTSLRPHADDLWIAAGGPCANFILTLLLFAVARWLPMSPDWAYGLVGVGILSAVIALFNLLPIPGLDGGHLLMAGAARLGWEMKRSHEIRLRRAGIRFVVLASLLPLLFSLWMVF